MDKTKLLDMWFAIKRGLIDEVGKLENQIPHLSPDDPIETIERAKSISDSAFSIIKLASQLSIIAVCLENEKEGN